MSSRRSTPLSWLLPLLLLLPPAGNLFWDFYPRRTRALAGGASADSPVAVEASVLRRVFEDQEHQLEWEREREAQRVRRWGQLLGRYTPLGADVIRLDDLSPRRNSFWVWSDSLAGVGSHTAVVHGDLEALVGIVKGAWPDRGIARVQTVWDRYFRVRFRYREAWGFLSGTGEVDAEGRPLLEIRHLGAEVAFVEGDTVVTDGEDGYYPGNIPIGTLFRQAAGERNGGQFMVRGIFSLGKVSRVMLLVDRAGLEVRASTSRKGEE